MTRRKPLGWYDTGDGLVPDCPDCLEWMTPMFMEAVYSVAIEFSGDPVDLAKRTIEQYHANRHREPR